MIKNYSQFFACVLVTSVAVARHQIMKVTVRSQSETVLHEYLLWHPMSDVVRGDGQIPIAIGI